MAPSATRRRDALPARESGNSTMAFRSAAVFLTRAHRRTGAGASRRESRYWTVAEASNRSDPQTLRRSRFEGPRQRHSIEQEFATDEFQRRGMALLESPQTKARHSSLLQELQSERMRTRYSTEPESELDESLDRDTARPESALPEMVSRRC